jgi:hypothetical protein
VGPVAVYMVAVGAVWFAVGTEVPAAHYCFQLPEVEGCRLVDSGRNRSDVGVFPMLFFACYIARRDRSWRISRKRTLCL